MGLKLSRRYSGYTTAWIVPMYATFLAKHTNMKQEVIEILHDTAWFPNVRFKQSCDRPANCSFWSHSRRVKNLAALATAMTAAPGSAELEGEVGRLRFLITMIE